MLVIAAYTDIRHGKVCNALTFPSIVLGLALNGIFWGLNGLMMSVQAGVLAIALLIIPVALKGLGAGDLKLLVAVGVLEGVRFLLSAFLWSALIFGVVSVVIISYRRLAFAALPTYANWGPGKVRALPFAAMVTIGSMIALVGR